MEKFEFGTGMITKVIEEIDKAKEYIRIVVFQIHNTKLINKLKQQVKDGISVEIITLPFSSINENVREDVSNNLNELKAVGGKIDICDWNVGDSSNTRTITGDWYLLHSKFIVTDKNAIVPSANLTN